MLIRNRGELLENKSEEIYDTLWEAIDELGIEKAINDETLMEIAQEQAEAFIEGLEEDYADMKREEQRDEL